MHELIKEKIDQLRVLYTEVDDRTAAFQRASGLNCPPGCGLCCRSTKVEATILEMLPLAETLHNGAGGIDWMEKLDACKAEKPCLFFQPDPIVSTDGHCRVYALRPLVCRLFGYAAFRDKNGTRKTTGCRRMRHPMTDDPERDSRWGDTAPAFVDYSIRISTLYPELGSRLFPINFAAYAAFEKYALWARLNAASASALPEKPEAPEPSPRRWKRAA